MNRITNLIDRLITLTIGIFYTFTIFTIGTFFPNQYVLKYPIFEYNTEVEFLNGLQTCIDYQNLTIPESRRIPNSMMVSQAVLETGWGSSRLSSEANNLYGIKSFDETKPHVHALENKKVMYRSFEHKCQSVGEYIRLLNNHKAYKKFRDLRHSMISMNMPLDSRQLVKTLDKYSETPDYAERVIRIIDRVENMPK